MQGGYYGHCKGCKGGHVVTVNGKEWLPWLLQGIRGVTVVNSSGT